MTNPSQPLNTATIVRLSRGSFDPARYADVERTNLKVAEYLIPAIRQLAGVQAFVAGVSPGGSIVNVSLWDSSEHADQMNRLSEMVVRARQDFEGLGVSFIPIVNYPIAWHI